MPYVPCRECMRVVPYGAAACWACDAPRPGSASAREEPARRRVPRLSWRLPLAVAALLLLAGGCGGSGGAPDPRRQKYEADKAHCEQISPEKAGQRSCMTYRGWPAGKFR
ncbi:MAG: hypothetical protein ACJ8GN_12675 [Longimicrobiaceae bacterium]